MAEIQKFPVRAKRRLGLLILGGLLLAGCLIVDFQITLNKDGSGRAEISYRFPSEHQALIEASSDDFPTSAAKLRAAYENAPGVTLGEVTEGRAGRIKVIKAEVEFAWIGDISTDNMLFLYFPNNADGPVLRVVVRRDDLALDSIRERIIEEAKNLPRFGNQNPKAIADSILKASGFTAVVELPYPIVDCKNAECDGARAKINFGLEDIEDVAFRDAIITMKPSILDRVRSWFGG